MGGFMSKHGGQDSSNSGGRKRANKMFSRRKVTQPPTPTTDFEVIQMYLINAARGNAGGIAQAQSELLVSETFYTISEAAIKDMLAGEFFINDEGEFESTQDVAVGADMQTYQLAQLHELNDDIFVVMQQGNGVYFDFGYAQKTNNGKIEFVSQDPPEGVFATWRSPYNLAEPRIKHNPQYQSVTPYFDPQSKPCKTKSKEGIYFDPQANPQQRNTEENYLDIAGVGIVESKFHLGNTSLLNREGYLNPGYESREYNHLQRNVQRNVDYAAPENADYASPDEYDDSNDIDNDYSAIGPSRNGTTVNDFPVATIIEMETPPSSVNDPANEGTSSISQANSRRKWLLAALGILLLTGTVAGIAIARSRSGGDNKNKAGNTGPQFMPTGSPSPVPSPAPTPNPSQAPTLMSSAFPTAAPTGRPTATPTSMPTADGGMTTTMTPTAVPSRAPTFSPTAAPTATASTIVKSTTASSTVATTTRVITVAPSAAPTHKPTAPPVLPTLPPFLTIRPPTAAPTRAPTRAPVSAPTFPPLPTPPGGGGGGGRRREVDDVIPTLKPGHIHVSVIQQFTDVAHSLAMKIFNIRQEWFGQRFAPVTEEINKAIKISAYKKMVEHQGPVITKVSSAVEITVQDENKTLS